MRKATKRAIQQDRVLTTNDIVFTKVFGSPQNSHILTGFINDILDLGATDVSVENTYNINTFYEINRNPHTKYTQVDVLARLEDGSQVTIEMQVVPQRLFRERAFFYAADIYIANYGKHTLLDNKDQYPKAEKKYSALRPVYSICVMAENEFPEDDNPIHEFRMYDVKNKMFYRNEPGQDVIKITFLEIKKSSNEMKENIKAWFDYFNKGNVANDAPKYIQEACAIASYKNLSREEANMISALQKSIDATQAREDYVWDKGKAEGIAEGKAEGKAEGIAEGKAEGIAEGKAEGIVKGIAEGQAGLLQAMISQGKTIQEIVEFTGIDEDGIKAMQAIKS